MLVLHCTSLLRRFFKIDLLRDATPAQLVRLDVTEKEATVPVRAIDIGIGAENAIKVFMGQVVFEIYRYSQKSLFTHKKDSFIWCCLLVHRFSYQGR